MKFRIVDALLLVASIAGAGAAVNSARTLHALQREDARLTGTLGDLVITDPAQLHIRAIDTGEPRHLAWRVYAPAGQITMSDRSRNNQSETFDRGSRPREFIGHVRFTEQPSAEPGVYRDFNNYSSFCTFGSPELIEFVRDHWSELEIEQVGADEVARLKSGESATVLRIQLPQSLMEKAREKKLVPRYARQPTPPIFECRLKLD